LALPDESSKHPFTDRLMLGFEPFLRGRENRVGEFDPCSDLLRSYRHDHQPT
jgi:hypothetical protein